MAKWLCFDESRYEDDQLVRTANPPPASRPFALSSEWLLPPLISELHRSFRSWEEHDLSPGPVVPERIWIHPQGRVIFRFGDGHQPQALPAVGRHEALAAWLVLLDKVSETYVVIARARALWSVSDLAGALAFVNAALLPKALLHLPPDNWERTARALAVAVADGALQGEAGNLHWTQS